MRHSINDRANLLFLKSDINHYLSMTYKVCRFLAISAASNLAGGYPGGGVIHWLG